MRLSQPLFLGLLVRHLSAAESEAYMYAVGIVLCSAMKLIVNADRDQLPSVRISVRLIADLNFFCTD